MIAPVRIWTRMIHTKDAREAKPVAEHQPQAEQSESPSWLGAWERLWTHHFDMTLPRFEE